MRITATRLPIRLSRAFLRYVTVGVLTNLTGYLVYLAVTAVGVGPKTAFTVLFTLTALASYMGNKQWTFAHQGHLSTSLPRFVAAYLSAYAINFVLLVVLVDRLGYPHQVVQAFAVCFVAAFLFVSLRFFVFAPLRASSD